MKKHELKLGLFFRKYYKLLLGEMRAKAGTSMVQQNYYFTVITVIKINVLEFIHFQFGNHLVVMMIIQFMAIN